MLASAPLPMRAQVTGGTITGTVTDTSGGAITNAEIYIKNTATGVTRNAAVSDAGLYSVPNLVPGPYQVSVSAMGFSNILKTGIILDVGATVTVNIAMAVGNVNQTIEVKEDLTDVEISTSTLSGVLNGTIVRELPLNARDWTTLATLEPGVATVRSQTALTISNNRPIRGLGTQLTIGGNRPQQNNYRVDGVSINDYSNGAPGSALGLDLGVDAVQEFSVVISNASAEYGKSSGGIVNAVTRSGTNSFHGTAYEFIRNSAVDARNFFDGTTVPPFKRNQFGASAGGPIRKDKTFIFGDYEGLRQSLSSTQNIFVPSPNARNGQLTSGKVTVKPQIVPFLALYPLPNGPINGDIGTFSFTTEQISREDYFTTRGDHRFSDHDSLVTTYFFDDGKSTSPDSFNAVLLGAFSRRQLVTIEESHVFSPSFLNSARFGYSRVSVEAPKALSAINPLASDPSLGFVPGKNVGGLNISGLTNFPGGFGGVGPYTFRYNSFQFYDDAFLTQGFQSIKFGYAFERFQLNQQGSANPAGVFTFGSLRNFLINGMSTSFNSAIPNAITPRDLRQSLFGFYVQDDMKLRPRFTLNLGLRYEISTVPTEVKGKLSNLPTLTSPTPNLGSPYFDNPTKLNLEPRVGFSWDPFGKGKTAIRSGFGIYDVLPLTYQFEILTILSAPFYLQANLANPPAGSFPTGAFGLLGSSGLRYAFVERNPGRSYVMQWNLNIEQDFARDFTVFLGYVGSRGNHLPFRADDVNVVQPASITTQGLFWPVPRGSGTKLNPSLGPISGIFWSEPSFYHALQTKVTKRMSHGLLFGSSYTWSKAIDTGSSTLIGNPFATSISSLPLFDPKLRRGLADFDIRHVLSTNLVWQAPTPDVSSTVVRWIVGGWQFGSIVQASSGVPFTATISGDPLGLNGFQATFAFPDRISGPGCGTAVNPGKVNYISVSCFAFPNPQTRLGTSGRNSLIGPGLLDWDASVFKNSPVRRISETFNIQFRMEFFNLLNHTNFTTPSNNQIFGQNGGAPLPSAGIITATSTPSRQIQFGLKFIW